MIHSKHVVSLSQRLHHSLMQAPHSMLAKARVNMGTWMIVNIGRIVERFYRLISRRTLNHVTNGP